MRQALRPVFDWFVNGLVIFNEQSELSPQVSIQMLKQADCRKQICDFCGLWNSCVTECVLLAIDIQIPLTEGATQ